MTRSILQKYNKKEMLGIVGGDTLEKAMGESRAVPGGTVRVQLWLSPSRSRRAKNGTCRSHK